MKRQRQVHLHLTDAEKDALEREAQRLGITQSEWVRHIIRPRLGLAVPGGELPTS